jgi:hypothetical protein
MDRYRSFFTRRIVKYIFLTFLSCFVFITNSTYAQSIRFDKNNIEPVNVFGSQDRGMGKDVIRVVKDSAVEKADEPTYIRIKGISFKNGTIEVKVLSRLLKNAPEFARGFIGVAFRINDSNTKFECIYIRPTNGRVEDQVRRNHLTD